VVLDSDDAVGNRYAEVIEVGQGDNDNASGDRYADVTGVGSKRSSL
jgi:hypothetical protein